jgi:hypothetical protein
MIEARTSNGKGKSKGNKSVAPAFGRAVPLRGGFYGTAETVPLKQNGSRFRTMAHPLGDDEAVAKMGHPIFDSSKYSTQCYI